MLRERFFFFWFILRPAESALRGQETGRVHRTRWTDPDRLGECEMWLLLLCFHEPSAEMKVSWIFLKWMCCMKQLIGNQSILLIFFFFKESWVFGKGMCFDTRLTKTKNTRWPLWMTSGGLQQCHQQSWPPLLCFHKLRANACDW